MKKSLQKRVLAIVLVFAMFLPMLPDVSALPVFRALDSTDAEPVVYDIYDLTGSKTNTVKGTDETWDGQVLGQVSEEHKENIVFKTKLTMGKQQVRLAINAKEGTSIYDPPGYAVYINDNNSAPYIAIKRNQQDLVVGSVPAVDGTYELEIGILDILTDGVRTGKHIYVKMGGETVCEVDDTAGYLTGDALGTRIVDFHYGAAIQMDTTYTDESIYGEANVYDIYDLTGSETNTVKGTDETWDGQVLGQVSEEHKENIVFKTKLTMGKQQVRLALNAKEGTSIYDPPGYAVYINDNNAAPYIAIKRNQKDLVVGSVPAVDGTYELEIGILDILTDGVRTGKHLYVKMDGETVCEVDDTAGYLTGDALGTRIVDFHYGAAIQMDTAKQIDPTEPTPTEPETTEPIVIADATVYDVYDLTGMETNTVKGTNDTWEGVVLGAVSADHKENMAFKTQLTMGAQQIRLSLNAKEGADIYDPPGYAVYLYGETGRVEIRRNNTPLVVGYVDSLTNTCIFEVGIVDILQDGNRIGKHLYVKIDDVTVCQYDDLTGYLTGDALGTRIVDFHYGAAIQMDTAKQIEPTEPEPTEPEATEPIVIADATVYDIYQLTGTATNTVKGTNDTWEGVVLGAVSADHKENMAFKTQLTMGAQQIRLSLNAKEGADIYDPPGYAVYLYGEAGRVEIRRNNTPLVEGYVDSLTNTCIFEVGIVDILQNGNRIGKHLYVKIDDVTVCQYDDLAGYLTGDALGTRIVDFHYGAAIQMDTTLEDIPTEPEPTEPTTTEPEVTEPSVTQTIAQVTVYDLYTLKGLSELTAGGQLQGVWGTTLGHVDESDKANVAYASDINVDEAQTIMLGIGLGDLSQAVQLNSGYVLEIVNKTGDGELDTVKIHRANKQIYIQDVAADFHGNHALEFGMADILQDGTVVGKRIYVKLDGNEVLHFDDMDGYLTADQLGTKVDIYVSGNDLVLGSQKNYTAKTANVYDLYDLTFRETLVVDHSDDNGEVIWGVLIGNVDDAHKGNVALKTKVTMSSSQQQNLIIGLGLNGHWPVGSGHGYKVELNGNPDNKTDSLFVYKNLEGEEPVCIYSMEQDFDFNSSFQLEVGVVDLTDEANDVVARRVYVLINGQELMHFDDTRNVISGSNMGTVVAAYASSGSVTLGTCVNGIPSTGVKTYDIFDLLSKATLKLNRTDAGGEVIWSNEIGTITDTNNMNYALLADLDISKIDRSQLQELIVGLCKENDLFDKVGYRLSLYFYPNGTTSVVLRDSNTDEVLANVDTVLAEHSEVEIGITDFFGSNKKLLGKKIYLKADGKEVLAYLDEDASRVRGNYLCAYTTTPITLATKYDYFTIPVTYVVNGETVESSAYVTTGTDVVVGRPSLIDVALGNKTEFTSVTMEQVLLNGQPIKAVSEKKGVYVFALENPSANDQLEVQIQVRNLTVDEADVYDLYDLTGKKEIILHANSANQIGTLFADGKEGILNRAIRFAYYIPKTGGGLRLGYGSDTSDIWSRVGTHIEIWCGFATISHGFHVSALSSGNTDIFQPDSWSIVEVGIVKCYEEGVYKYDRWYVKAGTSTDDLQLITYYDSTQRYDSSLNIMVRTPDTGDDFVLTSTLEIGQVTDESEETAKNEATVAFKPLFRKGETVKIVVYPKAGKALESLTVNGQVVETVLTSNGGYVFTLENAQDDVHFGYVLADDDSVYNVTAEEGANMTFVLDQTSVIAGGSVTVQIKMDGGYTLSSLTVNGADFLPMASYDKTTLTYTLTISGIREDKHIVAQAEKLSQDGPVAVGGAEETESETDLSVIAIIVAAVIVLGGAVVVTAKARKKGNKQ